MSDKVEIDLEDLDDLYSVLHICCILMQRYSIF